MAPERGFLLVARFLSHKYCLCKVHVSNLSRLVVVTAMFVPTQTASYSELVIACVTGHDRVALVYLPYVKRFEILVASTDLSSPYGHQVPRFADFYDRFKVFKQ